MIKTARFCLFLSTCALLTTAAQAQQVYRCGKSYSEKPCSGAVVVDTSDTRSKAQKQASQKVIQRDKQLAKEQENSRTKEDALAQAGRTPTTTPTEGKAKGKATPSKPAKSPSSKSHTGPGDGKTQANAKPKKKNEKEFFTAGEPAPQKKPKKENAQSAP